MQSLREAAKIEIGMRHFLEAGNFKGYTDTLKTCTAWHNCPALHPND